MPTTLGRYLTRATAPTSRGERARSLAGRAIAAHGQPRRSSTRPRGLFDAPNPAGQPIDLDLLAIYLALLALHLGKQHGWELLVEDGVGPAGPAAHNEVRIDLRDLLGEQPVLDRPRALDVAGLVAKGDGAERHQAARVAPDRSDVRLESTRGGFDAETAFPVDHDGGVGAQVRPGHASQEGLVVASVVADADCVRLPVDAAVGDVDVVAAAGQRRTRSGADRDVVGARRELPERVLADGRVIRAADALVQGIAAKGRVADAGRVGREAVVPERGVVVARAVGYRALRYRTPHSGSRRR